MDASLKEEKISPYSKEEEELFSQLIILDKYIKEAWTFAQNLTNGLFYNIISKENPFYDNCMTGEANFKHLIWKIEQIAKGDFSQNISFMNEFSDVFNLMVQQLKEREYLQEKLNKNKIDELNRELETQQKHYEQLSKIQNDFRRLIHDANNHALAVIALLEENKVCETLEYLYGLMKKKPFSSKITFTKNIVFDTIISEKMQTSEHLGINVISTIQVKGEMIISNHDIATIFGNSFDNAIQACSKAFSKRRNIHFTILQKENMLLFSIKNTALEKPAYDENGEIITAKKDTGYHGFGLKSIKEAVKKYDGNIEYKWEENIFTLEILLLNAFRE